MGTYSHTAICVWIYHLDHVGQCELPQPGFFFGVFTEDILDLPNFGTPWTGDDSKTLPIIRHVDTPIIFDSCVVNPAVHHRPKLSGDFAGNQVPSAIKHGWLKSNNIPYQ